MELQQVRYFVTLARTLNFTRAAEQCNVTQPALTKAVQKLEHEFGGELIHRERHFTQLTELGRIVLPMLERTLAAAESAHSQAQHYKRREIALLRLGFAPSVSSTLVVEPIADIARWIPGLQVELFEASTEDLITALLEGKASAVLVGEVGALPNRIDHWKLFTERYLLATAPDHSIAGPAPLDAAALSKTVWLAREGCEMAARFEEAMEALGVDVRRRHVGGQESHLQSLAAAGLGVALIPEHVPRMPGLFTRPLENAGLRRAVELLVMAGRRYSPALDAFVKIARVRDWLPVSGVH